MSREFRSVTAVKNCCFATTSTRDANGSLLKPGEPPSITRRAIHDIRRLRVSTGHSGASESRCGSWQDALQAIGRHRSS